MTAEEILETVHATIFREEDRTDLPEGLRAFIGLRNEAQRTRDGIIAVLDAIRELGDIAWRAQVDALKTEILVLGSEVEESASA